MPFSALIANSRRNSSDFETEWPEWTVPKDPSAIKPDSKRENNISASTARNVSGVSDQIRNVASLSTSAPNSQHKTTKPKVKKPKKPDTLLTTKNLYQAASSAASALLSRQESSNLSHEESNDSNSVELLEDLRNNKSGLTAADQIEAAKAAAKAERKQVKRAEKERRKLEKKKRKILEKQQRQINEVY